MQEVLFSFENVIKGDGINISLTGMGIVFTALILVSAYIALLPKIAGFFNKIIPPSAHHHDPEPAAKPVQGDQTEAEIVAAAVAYLQKNKS